jgi:CubicO group peptidase (beta-lactamase class C family)
MTFCALGVFGQDSTTKPATLLNSGEIQTRLESYMNPYFEQKDFSGVVMIVRGDEILVQKEYGAANLKTKAKNRLNTKFRVASLTKTLTAAAIIILRDRGKLKLDDSLSRFFPSFPNGKNITVEQLLLHRSGVGALDKPEDHRNCYTRDRLVEEIGKVKPYFPPGADSSYSNEGYNLLAAIIEKVSGETYENFLRKNIFQPLGMRDSGSFCSESKTSNLAVGYVTGTGIGTIEALPFNEFVQMGSGSVYSTAPDLHKWLKAVNENRLFQIDKLRYPYGWGVREYTGNKLIEQSGLVEGFNAYIALYAPEKLYVIFLSNVQSGLFNRVARDLKAVAFGGEFSRPNALSRSEIPRINSADYAGAYRTPDISVPLNVVQKNGNLYLQWGNYPFLRSLTPVAKDKFYYRAEYAEIIFERGDDGRIEKIKWQSSPTDSFYLTKVVDR